MYKKTEMLLTGCCFFKAETKKLTLPFNYMPLCVKSLCSASCSYFVPGRP